VSRYLAFAAKTPVLFLSFFSSGLLLVWVFPALPVGAPLLDTLPGYSPSLARELLGNYGAEGRRWYAVASPTLDTLLPICYTTFFAGMLYRCQLPGRFAWVVFVPIAVALWDLLENLQITSLLLSYPDVTDGQILWASAFTWVKGVVLVPAMLLVVVFAVLYRMGSRSRRG